MSYYPCNPAPKRTRDEERADTPSKKPRMTEPIICPHPDFYEKAGEPSTDSLEDTQIEIYRYKQTIKKSLKAHYKLIIHQTPTINGTENFIKWVVDMLHKCMALRYSSMNLNFIMSNSKIANISCDFNEIVSLGIASKIVRDSLNFNCNDDIQQHFNGIVIKARDCLRDILPDTVMVTIINTSNHPYEDAIHTSTIKLSIAF